MSSPSMWLLGLGVPAIGKWGGQRPWQNMAEHGRTRSRNPLRKIGVCAVMPQVRDLYVISESDILRDTILLYDINILHAL